VAHEYVNIADLALSYYFEKEWGGDGKGRNERERETREEELGVK